MATWRRRDLERRSGERNRRVGRILRADILIPMLALLVAGLALWQALAAQTRAEALAHDLSVANGRLRNLESYSAAPPAPRSAGEGGTVANPPLPPLVPTGRSPSSASSNP